MLVRMMLAGVPVAADAAAELARIVRAAGADGLADRLERALDHKVMLLAPTIDERAIIPAALEDPQELAELRAVLLKRARVAPARRDQPVPRIDRIVS